MRDLVLSCPVFDTLITPHPHVSAASSVASIVFCGASFGIVDEDDDGEEPALQRFDVSDGATKEESEDAFLTELTSVLSDGVSVKKVRAGCCRPWCGRN